MEQPSVSVVIPVFNGERYLQQAIASALEQTYPPHEVVVVDDGSTDASRSIVESFGGKVICKIQQNLGPSAARNLGTEVSTGEWIAYLDADDYWLPDKLEKQISVIRRQPSVDLIYTGRTESGADGRTAEIRARTPQWTKKRLRFENPLFPTTIIARRSLLLRHPWTTSFRSSEDWWYFYRLSKEVEFAAIEEPTVVYRLHSESLTHRDWRSVLGYAQQVSEKIQEDFQGLERINLKRKVDRRLFANAAIAAREQGSSGYLGLIIRSLVSWPFPDIWPARYKLFAKMLIQSLQAPSAVAKSR